MICHYYWLIEPIRSPFQDTSEREPVFTVNIQFPERKCPFALFVDNNGVPEYARFSIPDCKSNKILTDKASVIQEVKEHLLSVLRLSYDPNIQLFPIPVWMFCKDGEKHSAGLKISLTKSERAFNVERVKNFFAYTLHGRQQIKLLADGNDQNIPLQYRFLSLYKILELAYYKSGKMDRKALNAFLEKYVDDFKAMQIHKSPVEYLKVIRDKCAHIRTGKTTERMVLGVTHLDPKYVEELTKFMPLFLKICADLLNEAFGKDMKIKFEKRNYGKPVISRLNESAG